MRLGWTLMIVPLLLGASFASACGDNDDDEASPTATVTPAAAVSNEVKLTQEDDGTTIHLALNGTLIVALPSNPSTGFAWAVTPPEAAGLALQGEPQYVPPGSTTPAVGAAGTQVFTFDATEPGEFQITLTYARSFEPGAEGKRTFTAAVRVIDR